MGKKEKIHEKIHTCAHARGAEEKAIRARHDKGAHLRSISKSVMYRNWQPLLSTAAKCSVAVFETGLTFGLPVHKIISISQYREACGSTIACRDGGETEIGITSYYFISSNYWQGSSCT